MAKERKPVTRQSVKEGRGQHHAVTLNETVKAKESMGDAPPPEPTVVSSADVAALNEPAPYTGVTTANTTVPTTEIGIRQREAINVEFKRLDEAQSVGYTVIVDTNEQQDLAIQKAEQLFRLHFPNAVLVPLEVMGRPAELANYDKTKSFWRNRLNHSHTCYD